MNDTPTRYAVQKARGSGWKTLEVGDDLNQVRARFQAMCRVNAKAYFRIVSLDPLPGSTVDTDHEFAWKLIELRDPNAGGGDRRGGPKAPTRRASGKPARPARTERRRPREKVGIPVRIWLAGIGLGLTIGALAYLFWSH